MTMDLSRYFFTETQASTADHAWSCETLQQSLIDSNRAVIYPTATPLLQDA